VRASGDGSRRGTTDTGRQGGARAAAIVRTTAAIIVIIILFRALAGAAVRGTCDVGDVGSDTDQPPSRRACVDPSRDGARFSAGPRSRAFFGPIAGRLGGGGDGARAAPAPRKTLRLATDPQTDSRVYLWRRRRHFPSELIINIIIAYIIIYFIEYNIIIPIVIIIVAVMLL